MFRCRALAVSSYRVDWHPKIVERRSSSLPPFQIRESSSGRSRVGLSAFSRSLLTERPSFSVSIARSIGPTVERGFTGCCGLTLAARAKADIKVDALSSETRCSPRAAKGVTLVPTLRGARTGAVGKSAMHHSAPLRSELGHKRTHAPQQRSHHSITVGTREQHGRRYGTSAIFRSTSVS
jgi:hypothetical protein